MKGKCLSASDRLVTTSIPRTSRAWTLALTLILRLQLKLRLSLLDGSLLFQLHPMPSRFKLRFIALNSLDETIRVSDRTQLFHQQMQESHHSRVLLIRQLVWWLTRKQDAACTTEICGCIGWHSSNFEGSELISRPGGTSHKACIVLAMG